MGRKSRFALIAIIAALGAAGGQFAFATVANDVFTDVPSSAADHDAINRVYQAGIMNPCSTSPMKFCPNNTTLRRGIAKQYDYALGLSGTPGNFGATFRDVKVTGTLDAANLLRDNVTASGAGAGDAIGITKPSTGHYTVTFARSVEYCTPVVTPGRTGTFFAEPTRNDLMTTANTGGDHVDVYLQTVSGTATDNPFHLIVLC